MNHFTTPEFWKAYKRLPPEVRELADKCFALLREDPHHPSLRLKKIGKFWSARVGLRYRALARDREEDWFGSGSGIIANTRSFLECSQVELTVPI
jgi:hypothetical protein